MKLPSQPGYLFVCALTYICWFEAHREVEWKRDRADTVCLVVVDGLQHE
jgi:hypothetical protein